MDVMVLHYSTDLRAAAMRRDVLQCANKDREEEDCELVNMDVNNSRFKIL